ncbi:MAG TPA: XRE family transcriptional regulator [Blastococcus sp.]|nr:XRE family transcriptional regulator [Blastococcus sp.]
MPTTATEKVTRAHERSVTASTADIARYLQEVLGPKLTAHLAGKSNARTVTTWASGTNKPQPDAEERLRLAYQVVHLIQADESLHVVRAWLIGLNPQLDDEAPATAIREGRFKEVLTAARAFIAGG